MTRPSIPTLTALFLLSACGGQADGGSGAPTPSFTGIAAEETIHFTGTEPFWGGTIEGTTATYSTPEAIDGTTFPVERFAGNSGIGISGTMGGATWDMTITEGECSDGMSDRTYPFTVTLIVGGEQREGCAWTASRPFDGPPNP